MLNPSDDEKYHIEQRLSISIPPALMDALLFAEAEVQSKGGFRGGAVAVQYSSRSMAGTLVFFPGVSPTTLVGK